MDDRLRRIPRVLQHGDSGRVRRWYTCPSADLYVFEQGDTLDAFEFCYGKPRHEHSLRWSAEHGFSHSGIDDGEGTPFQSKTPIASTGSAYDLTALALLFERLAVSIEPRTYRTVLRIMHLRR